MDEGNERIIGILINSDPKICVVCVYLPTNNASVNSIVDYGECLDILDHIINNYSGTYKVVIAGDFNGTLLRPRVGNKQDVSLQAFVRDHKLLVPTSIKPTFVQHSGAGSSQIDYILSSHEDVILDYITPEKHATNLSSHNIVTAVLASNISSKVKHSHQSTAIWKYQWDKTDLLEFRNIVQLELGKCNGRTQNVVDESNLELLMTILQKATKVSTPRKIIHLKGPKWKASPTAKILLDICHNTYREWCENGKPEGQLKHKKVKAQRELRRQFRMEKTLDRQDLYNQIMENPSTELFHRLIKRNRGSSVVKTHLLKIDNSEVNDPVKQRGCFMKYFEDLAVPKDKGYDEKYLELCTIRHKLISEMCSNSTEAFVPFTENEIQSGINHLHAGKAIDEFDICAEQLKAAGDILVPIITKSFNSILSNGAFPDALKSGILTPILKKLKDPSILDNYRGITVTPVFTKLFECVLLPKIEQHFGNDQSPLQFGFTKGLSMLLAALIISEAKCESKLTPLTPLCLITVDSMKAFDVVSHIIVLDKLYETGVHPKIWTIVKDLYNGMTSKVRWAGGISDNFKILQGVRQGGILSPLLYKIYNNNLLMELQMARLGFRIGNIYMGCPTCADDIALLSRDTNELQCMLSTLHRHSLQDRVTIHPTKTKAVVFSKTKSIKSSLSWKLGDSDISPTNQAVHLGILRIQEILELYELPDIDSLLLEQPSKLAFKYQCKCAIQKTWTNLLKAEMDNKSTLKYINVNVLSIGTPHTLWKSLRSMVSEVKMGITKARMLTGTFMTQATRYKFKIENADHICQLCAIYSEDIKHILLECPALHSVRQLYYSRLKLEVIHVIGEKKWLELFGNHESILLLILDCSNFSGNFNTEQITVITKISTELCHQLYIKRLKLLEGLKITSTINKGTSSTNV
ncbi:unnamed protein product [Mytilus edulis]|uniref:Reverse transcriptase domain-containing protein n=1 Tax=Mytilus edulis TaxID=6550 RepID=A0A8S3V5W1_MYTED|nr:unnamed protein product [Mytilus edulis]